MAVSNRIGFIIAALAGAWLLNACASSPKPAAPERSRAAVPATPPAEAPAPEIDAPAPTADQTPAPAAASPAPARLAWVNPARCLSSCAFDPGDTLSRVNEHGVADPNGRHRVDATALAALRELLAGARAAGHVVKISSAYRSYDDQVRVFRTTKEKGRAARPGHSEHQLGTAIDLRLPTTRAIDWLAEHVAAYGFVLSYPPGKQRLTGYRPEPWHVRFVGTAVAAEVVAGGSLEELFRRRPELATAHPPHRGKLVVASPPRAPARGASCRGATTTPWPASTARRSSPPAAPRAAYRTACPRPSSAEPPWTRPDPESRPSRHFPRPASSSSATPLVHPKPTSLLA
jgi:D-alanyl-D-alanine carboxypeptidase